MLIWKLFGTPRGRPRKDAQPDRSWKGTQREAPAVKEKTARSLAWKVVYREVASTNSRVGELINKIKDHKECSQDLRDTWTMKHNVSGRESLQRKTTSPGSCPSCRSAIMTTRCSLSRHRKTLDFEFPEHFLNCFYFSALHIFIHVAFYHLCHQCLRNIQSKKPFRIKSGIKIHCCLFLD